MRRVFGWVGQVIVWLVLLVFLTALAAAVLVPRIFGGTPYTVLTGSMEPNYPPGTLVVVKPIATEQIQQGDVITYQLESGRSTVVTHRVIAVGTRLDGEKVFTTQGDANDTPDPAPVRAVQVRGKLWYSVRYLGHANTALNGGQRQTAVFIVAGLLIGYAAFMSVGAVRDWRRKPQEAPLDEVDADLGTTQLHQHQLYDEEVRSEHSTTALSGDRGHRRTAALAALGLLVAGTTIYMITRRRGRSNDRPGAS